MSGAHLFRSTVTYEEHLNPEQLQVVMHPGGPMLVIAGAGTGKTRTLTYRVLRLLERGVPRQSILLLTFTNRAAREMLHRVETLLGEDLSGLWGGTSHHIGHLILRRHATLLGYRTDFTIIDREDQKELLESCITEVMGEESSHPRGPVLAEMYSLMNSLLMEVEEVIERRFHQFLELTGEIKRSFILYETKKRQQNLMDFDDLLLNTLRLFEQQDELRQFYASRFEHILVDEYQDTNLPQVQLIDLLSSVHRNVMVVGDDAQSIYSFRGASIRNILTFPERYPDATVFKLTINYRSTPQILDLANHSISHNRHQFQKVLRTVRPSGLKPLVVSVHDNLQQAEVVADLIEGCVNEGVPLDDIAVLYRSHYQSMECQIELQRRGIPFEVRSGLRFFEQAHIKDILSYLRVLINPYDELSWKRLLKMVPGIGQVTAERVWNHLRDATDPLRGLREAETQVLPKARASFRLLCALIDGITRMDYLNSPEEVIQFVLESAYREYLHNTYPNAESRYEDILQLINYARAYQTPYATPHTKLELLLSDLSLDRTEPEQNHRGGVTLSSVHQAKGLEWRRVIVIGLNEGRFPSKKALHVEGEEEERRLFYVACTRAMEGLYLLYCRFDGYRELQPSRFLRELSPDLYETAEVQGGYL